MTIRLAIHHEVNSFSERWIEYCEEKSIQYKLVNCYESNILEQIDDCDALLFNWWHTNSKAQHFMKQLTISVESTGKEVFPNFETCWHYDDKIGQKYLLESKNIPHIKTHVFYDRESANSWSETTDFPKVFKLKGGAGSVNVKLIRTKKDANKAIKTSFTKGHALIDRYSLFKDRIIKFKQYRNIETMLGLFKGVARLFVRTTVEKNQSRDIGYIYFQDFVPNNDHDIRIIVIGDKAFGIKRYCREGDFRASGSGNISYSKKDIPEELIKLSFEYSNRLNMQSVAFDYIYDNGKPLVVEISYAFSISAYDPCVGYWDRKLHFHDEHPNPQYFMIEDIVNKIKSNKDLKCCQ